MKSFVIYGAASIGNIVKNILDKYEVEIKGYIDKRSFELESYNQLPVWSLDDIPKQYITDEIIVFVGVKNVFEHEKIARMLVNSGFRYIIYKPYSVLLGNGNKEERIISDIYDMFLQASPDAIKIKLPVCTIDKKISMYDYAILKEDDTDVIAYIPAEFIFTNNYQHGGMVKWGNINILSFFTHIDFFRFLDGRKDASPGAYLKEYCEYTAGLQNEIIVTNAWKENVINNRMQIFEKMCESMNFDSDFFIRNAPEAVWNNEKHIFNLTSGKHRSTFLAAKGIKYIPLKIKKADYNNFFHKDEVEKVNQLLFDSEMDIMIPHPCFYRDDRNVDRGEYAFFSWFARYYGRKSFYIHGKVTFQNLKIKDYLDDMGCFARFAIRLGCEVHKFNYPTELEKQLNQLFYSEISYESENDNSNGFYDLIIIEESKIDKILNNVKQCKNIIVKDCTKDIVESICNEMKLKIVLKIVERYIGLELKSIYFLEQDEI